MNPFYRVERIGHKIQDYSAEILWHHINRSNAFFEAGLRPACVKDGQQ
ncbi:MAG: hypothetical protein WDO14_15345 [Bacteroidota bacterium]